MSSDSRMTTNTIQPARRLLRWLRVQWRLIRIGMSSDPIAAAWRIPPIPPHDSPPSP